MTNTTIKLGAETKIRLDHFREYKNESYDEVIHKLLYIASNAKKNPELSKEAVQAIEAARKRIAKGHYVSEEDMKKRLGIDV